MALRDQPYIPLYVQDFLTDEKLNACLPATQGVYIKIMCLFHKCEPYGGILLKQKDKQNESMCLNFALKLANLLPFNLPIIQDALSELLDEKVLCIDGDFLFQRRMVKDNEISIKRANSGEKGGRKTQSKSSFDKAKDKANIKTNLEAKNEQNPEYENEYEYEYKDELKEKEKRVTGKKETKPKKQITELIYPFDSKLFFESWNMLLTTPKWKKKIPHSLQIALSNLGKYKEEFSIMLINKAIENDWQGVTYSDTDEQYQKWLNKNGNSEIRKTGDSNRQNTAGNNAEDKKRSVSRLVDMAETILQNS